MDYTIEYLKSKRVKSILRCNYLVRIKVTEISGHISEWISEKRKVQGKNYGGVRIMTKKAFRMSENGL